MGEQTDTDARQRGIDAISQALAQSCEFVVGILFGTPPELDPHEVRRSIAEIVMDEADRRALLDALDHGDCVPRGWCDGYVNDAEARAERAERERDALRADNARLCEALRPLTRWSCAWPTKGSKCDCAPCVARAALSADAEPCDCEPIHPDEHQPDCATRMAQPDAGREPGIKSEGKGQMENIGPIKEPPPPPTQEEALEYYQHVPHTFERGKTSLCRWCGRLECTPLHID